MMHAQQRPGAMLLITVMIMGAVALLIGMGLALRGIGEMEMSFSSSQSKKVQALADGCLEEVLLQLWGDSSYSGGNISLGEGSCVVSIAPEDDMKRISITASIAKWQGVLSALVDSESMTMQLREWRQLP